MPSVSIIVPTYNRPELLRRALASCRGQTCRDFELIVVNDAGVDVAAIAAEFDAAYIPLAKNRGLAGARNAGVAQAQGIYLAFLDDDDLLLPEHLARLLACATPDTICYSDYWRVTADARIEQVTPEFDYERILHENFIPVNCFLAPRELLVTVGSFDEWLTALEDWDLWLRLSRFCRFHHVAGATCEVHIGRPGESITTSHPFGFSWASLNILHKNMQLLSDRSEFVKRCGENALAALQHLKALLVRQLESGGHDFSAIFGRHDLATAAARLAELREVYRLHGTVFFEVEGYVQLLRGQPTDAQRCFEHAVAVDPTNHSAAAILTLLAAHR